MKTVLEIKLSPATKRIITSRGNVTIYKENRKKWDRLSKVKKAARIISVTNGFKSIESIITAFLPMPAKTNVLELKDEVAKVTRFVTENAKTLYAMRYRHYFKMEPSYIYIMTAY